MIRRLVIAQVLLLAGIIVIVLAVAELHTNGTQGFGGLTVADRLAAAEKQDEPAPSFSIESLDVGTVSLQALRGHVVVLNFWATWCGPCRLEAPAFDRLSHAYGDQGVRFLGMNELDDRAAAQTFVRQFELDYPSGFDPAGRLADDFRLYALPTTFLIDPEGIVRYRFVGYLDEPTLRSAIDDLLQEDG